jgi:hypothetical protein
MYPPVATKNTEAVQREVRVAFATLYPHGESAFVATAFGWAIACFTGHYPGFQAVDARYHDLEHTMQGTLCMMRLLLGREQAGAEPRLSERDFRLGLLAILLHDTGYLKKHGDNVGTGAKYTITHVARSADFAGHLLSEKGLPDRDIHAVQHMIRCTGLNARLAAIPFESSAERIAGYALATADLLGQMSADDYVDKLPILYSEFAEATAYSGDHTHFISTFTSAEDLIRRTAGFWENGIRPKLDSELLGLWRFLSRPYPDGPNEYIDRIEANMARIQRPPQPAQATGHS